MANIMHSMKPVETRVVGNDYTSDGSLGFKEDVKAIFESYMNQGVNLGSASFLDILTDPNNREQFNSMLTESFMNDPMFTSAAANKAPFYTDYVDRYSQLNTNSMNTVAQEAVMQGYAPIVAYNPFFLKNQWVNCVFKDVLMTEVPTAPVINLAYEHRYIKTQDGKRYEIPNVFYDDERMAELNTAATGMQFDKTKDHDLPLQNADVLTEDYVPDIVVWKDRSEMLTQDLTICAVSKDGSTWIPTDIRTDVTTHNWINSTVKLGEDETDTLVGNIDFDAGTVTVFSTGNKITKVRFSGHLAGRFNERSLDVERRVEQIQHVMPESGPRFNTPVTIEDAADALALQNVDQIADNIDMMGRSLAEMEDFEIRTFLDESFKNQKAIPTPLYDSASMIVEGSFNLLPYEQYAGTITNYMTDSREWFERQIDQLKNKLKTPNIALVAVCHPTLIRFLQNGIDWVFTDETQLSGVKISYNFGIYTSAQDRIHIITSHYLKPEAGIMTIAIPLTKEVVTFKHYKYNMVIDRGYRSPVHSLVPNIMATHRTLTFEVQPVQGRFYITNRDLISPETLIRSKSAGLDDFAFRTRTVS